MLIATDIAARGIDVDGISHVINFDFPPQPEDYVHRIGRTGRAQAIGDAISFVTHDDADNLRRLERFLGRGITRKKLEGFVATTPHPPSPSAANDWRLGLLGTTPGSSRPKGPRSGSFGPKRFGQRRSRPQGRRGRTLGQSAPRSTAAGASANYKAPRDLARLTRVDDATCSSFTCFAAGMALASPHAADNWRSARSECACYRAYCANACAARSSDRRRRVGRSVLFSSLCRRSYYASGGH